jgi:hypothetical protein
MKQFSTIFAAGIILFFTSCSGGSTDDKKAQDSTATNTAVKPAFEPFNVMVIAHKVKNFEAWKIGYLANDSLRNAYGISSVLLGRGLDDSNMVQVVDKFTDLQKGKEFAALPRLKEVMQKAGVISAPTFDYINVIRDDTSMIDQNNRLMVKHKVKDFNAWLKVFDNEGPTKRAEYGLIDRGIGRASEDSTMVYILFAVTDMAKVKARMASEDFKKLTTDAGVLGTPEAHFFRVVK